MSSLRSFLNPISTLNGTEIKLSPKEVKELQDACVSDAPKINRHLDSKFDDLFENLESQISAIKDIAQSAERQADSISQQVDILKEQLSLAKFEAESAKKDALFSKITAIIALIISLAAIIVPQIQFG